MQIGDISRAHNRDMTRLKCYDDLRADDPSCCFGITRRLQQSVLDHPLFIPLLDLVEAQIVSQMRESFESKINRENSEALLHAWQECVEFPSKEYVSVLHQIDPSPQEIEQIKKRVLSNLEKILEKVPRLIDYIHSNDFQDLLIKKLKIPREIDCYALMFASQTNLGLILHKHATSSIQAGLYKNPQDNNIEKHPRL